MFNVRLNVSRISRPTKPFASRRPFLSIALDSRARARPDPRPRLRPGGFFHGGRSACLCHSALL